MNVIDNIILQRYQAATTNMADDQIVQYGADDQLGNGTRTAGAFRRAFGITQGAKSAIAANNRVRQDFLDAVKACCGCDGKPFAELPPEVLAAFKGTHASSAADDLGLNEAGRVASGKPLTARRIRAVLSAVQTYKLRENLKNVIYTHLQHGCNRFPVVNRCAGTILSGFCTNVVNQLTDPDLLNLPVGAKRDKLQRRARAFVGFADAFLYTLKEESAENARYRETHPGVTREQMEADCKKGILTQFFYVLEELNRDEATRVCDEDTVREVKAKMLEEFGYDDEFADGIVWNNEENVNV